MLPEPAFIIQYLFIAYSRYLNTHIMASPTVKMRIPYQCMTRCGDILVAARGSSIDAFKLQDGSILSTWTASASPKAELASDSTTNLAAQTTKSSSIDGALDTTPPAKKRKLSPTDQSPVPAQVEVKNEKRKQNNRSSSVSSGLNAPAVIVLASTTDGKHVIAVTGEDKCIRVFEHVKGKDDGQRLKQLSQRYK